MNAVEAMRLFSDGQTSMHDLRALIVSMGHSEEDFVEALSVLCAEPAAQWRVQRARDEELHSEIFLRVST